MSQRWKERKKKRKFGLFPAIRWRGKKDAWSRGAVPTRREWTRPEREGENHGAQTTWRRRKMVILHPEPAPGYTAPLGATLLGRVALVRRARRPDRGSSSAGPSPGWSPSRGGRGRPPGERERPATEGALRATGGRKTADGIWAPGGRRLRGGGATAPFRAPSTTAPSPSASPYHSPKTGCSGGGSAAPRPGPLRFP